MYYGRSILFRIFYRIFIFISIGSAKPFLRDPKCLSRKYITWGFVGYGRVVAKGKGRERENIGGFQAGDANDRRVEKMERENGGLNLGRPAPRAARKLGQVFCTCRSNVGTFVTALIVVVVVFRFPIFHPSSSLDVVVFRLCLRPAGNHREKDVRKLFYTE